jgi:hypothetical protein
MTTSATKKGLWRLAEVVGLPALISIFVSALISGWSLVYFESRLVTSEHHAQEISLMQQQLDGAQSNMIGQFSVYAAHLYDVREVDPSKRDELLKAVTAAESQILNLRASLPASNQRAVEDYDQQLDAFVAALQAVKFRGDMGPAYTAFQKVLESHRTLDAQLAAEKTISIF